MLCPDSQCDGTVVPLAGARAEADDQRDPKCDLLAALCTWWDDAGEVSPAGVYAYAPKYQVVCKETVQKLLFAWLRTDPARDCHGPAACLSYQEFASKLGEPGLWSSWWAEKIEPATGINWGKGQWCRLYRLHNALPPFVQLRTLSEADADADGEARPAGSTWLAVQADVLRCLEDWWGAVGMVLPAKCRVDASFTVGELDDLSFAQADDSKVMEHSGTDLLEHSLCNDVSMDYTIDLDTTADCSVDYWNEQLLNHRDLVQGLYEWLHSSPDPKRRYPVASSVDKYSFRAHLNQVWGLWWVRMVEPRSGIPWGRCGRFNRRLRLPSFIRLKERTTDETEVTRDLEVFDATNSTAPPVSHRSVVRKALLEAFKDWWQEAGTVLRPAEMTEAMKRDLHSDHNVTKQKIQSLLYLWLRTPARAATHPLASSVKFRALSSMLGYLWGRWWDICVAPIAAVRWGGSGRFSNKGVLPPFVRLRQGFVGSDGMRPPASFPHIPAGSVSHHLVLSQIDYESDGDELTFDDSRASCLLDSSFLADLPDNLDEAFLPHSQPPLLPRRTRSVPSPSLLGPGGPQTPVKTREGGAARASSSVLSAYSQHLQSGLLEVLRADDDDDAPVTLQSDFDIELESPFAQSLPQQDSTPKQGLIRAPSLPTPGLSPVKGANSAWEAVDWSPTTTDGQSPSLFTSEHLHTIPVDGPAAAGYHSWGTSPVKPANPVQDSHHQPAITVTVTTAEAAICQQAMILSDLIATRAALSPNAEEMAQLSMAKHLLQGMAGGGAAAPSSPVVALAPPPPSLPPPSRSTSLSDRLSALMLGLAPQSPPLGQQRRRGLAARLMPSMYHNFQRS